MCLKADHLNPPSKKFPDNGKRYQGTFWREDLGSYSVGFTKKKRIVEMKCGMLDLVAVLTTASKTLQRLPLETSKNIKEPRFNFDPSNSSNKVCRAATPPISPPPPPLTPNTGLSETRFS